MNAARSSCKQNPTWLKQKRGNPRIELGTSRTLSENYTTKPIAQWRLSRVCPMTDEGFGNFSYWSQHRKAEAKAQVITLCTISCIAFSHLQTVLPAFVSQSRKDAACDTSANYSYMHDNMLCPAASAARSTRCCPPHSTL